MKTSRVGMVCGALLVSLALTAGKQFAEARTQEQRVDECHKQYLELANSQTLKGADFDKLLEVIRVQKEQLEQLRSQLSMRTSMNHNEHGGYIAACGSLPGMVSDDC